jgi:hypothetical protein
MYSDASHIQLCMAIFKEVLNTINPNPPSNADLRLVISSISLPVNNDKSNRECFWPFVYGMALSHYQQRLSFSSMNILPILNEDHPLIQMMCRSPIELARRLIQWTSSQQGESLLPYMNVAWSSPLYRHLLTTSISALSSIHYEHVVDWNIDIPSNMCKCTDCISFHPFFVSSTTQSTRFRASRPRLHHVETKLNETFGIYEQSQQCCRNEMLILHIPQTSEAYSLVMTSLLTVRYRMVAKKVMPRAQIENVQLLTTLQKLLDATLCTPRDTDHDSHTNSTEKQRE